MSTQLVVAATPCGPLELGEPMVRGRSVSSSGRRRARTSASLNLRYVSGRRDHMTFSRNGPSGPLLVSLVAGAEAPLLSLSRPPLLGGRPRRSRRHQRLRPIGCGGGLAGDQLGCGELLGLGEPWTKATSVVATPWVATMPGASGWAGPWAGVAAGVAATFACRRRATYQASAGRWTSPLGAPMDYSQRWLRS